jgi:hypothetical protein
MSPGALRGAGKKRAEPGLLPIGIAYCWHWNDEGGEIRS